MDEREAEIHRVFPGTLFQKCVVHKMRNVLNKVRPRDKQEVAKDLNEVLDNFDKDSTLERAKAKLATFITQWSRQYPELLLILENERMEYYFTYIQFPATVRRMIYTTHSIESLNKKLRKATKNKKAFEKPDRFIDYLY